MPDLPKKKVVGNMAPAFVEQRKAELERYMQHLAVVTLRHAVESHQAAAPRGSKWELPLSMRPLFTFIGAEWLLDDETEIGAEHEWAYRTNHGAMSKKILDAAMGGTPSKGSGPGQPGDSTGDGCSIL
jgi:hypothetical protein|eukprot:SAG25_NODE_100_length_15542_cov_15.293337_8_plen_128_part_00